MRCDELMAHALPAEVRAGQSGEEENQIGSSLDAVMSTNHAAAVSSQFLKICLPRGQPVILQHRPILPLVVGNMGNTAMTCPTVASSICDLRRSCHVFISYLESWLVSTRTLAHGSIVFSAVLR